MFSQSNNVLLIISVIKNVILIKTEIITEDNLTKYSYVDNYIDILIFISDQEKFTFSLTNISNNSIKIIWNDAVFVDVDGTISKVMHEGIKYSEKEKEFHQNIKKSIQQDLLHETENGQQLFFLFDEKKAAIAKYNKLIKNAKNALESEQLKIKKQAIIDDFDEKIEKIQELLSDAFDELYEMKLINYPIFMAMAENIGYDATGKETPTNELEDISKELLKFINAIENEKDSFFS